MLMLSDISLWGYVYLKSGKVPYLDFPFREEYFLDYVAREGADVNDFIYVENKDIPFKPQFFSKLQALGLDTRFRVVDIRGDVRIYLNINKARPEIRAKLQ